MKSAKFISLLIMVCMALCGCTTTTSKRNPFMVLIYGDNKEIELYYGPNVAIVDGQSGCWEYGVAADIRYEIHYGEKECAISTTKKMIYFGSMMDAIRDLHHEENWVPYREKR